MQSTHAIGVLTIIAMIALGGCANNGPQQASTSYAAPYRAETGSRYGTIESIQLTRAEHSSSGAGAIVGGLVGGLLGNQVGSGNGRTAATVVGVAGGALVGNNIEQNRNTQAPDMYQIGVYLDNGDRTTIMQDSVRDLRVGNRVRIADGRAYRY